MVDHQEKQTVMAVDDTPANLKMLQQMLSGSGYRVMVFPDGESALAAAVRSHPDLILLDINMPKMDGFEVCERLKADEKLKEIPVIFISALNETTDKIRAFAAGGVDYVTKPFQFEEVQARVKAHLSLCAARRKLNEQNEILQENMRLLEQIEQIARHDLKSPLTVFMNASDYLTTAGSLTPEQIEFLTILDSSAAKMLTMIDHSLDLFKMERGQYTVKPVPVDMIRLVRLVCKEIQSLAEAKTVTCSVLLNGHVLTDSAPCLLQGEPTLLSTIVSNLLKNAIEASPAGEKVGVSLTDQNPFLIEVKNQGVIPPDIRYRFLERYATSGKARGTGLGGYSARLMARTLGGDIRFVSTPETGTVITVSLPHQAPAPKKEMQAGGGK